MRQVGKLESFLIYIKQFKLKPHTNIITARVMPRIYRHGGFEANTGIIINPVSPELAAKLLRESYDV